MGEGEEVIDIKVTYQNCGLGSVISKTLDNVYSYMTKTGCESLTVNLFWEHFLREKKVSYAVPEHFEDYETVLDVHTYLHNMVEFPKYKINFNHIIDYAPKDKIKNSLFEYCIEPSTGHFKFRNNLKTKKNKICFWGFDKNLSSTQRFSIVHTDVVNQTYDDWIKIRTFLESHYDVVEISYRTPIREVFYHLSTCEFSIGYAGAFHKLSIYLQKPNILIKGLNNKSNPKTLELKESHSKFAETVFYRAFNFESKWFDPYVDEVCNIDNLNYYKKVAFDNIEKFKLIL
jgi:hypothetical protein